MPLQIRAVGGPTGRLLTSMLQERGLIGTPGGVVSYGVRIQSPTLPTLNANAGKFDKLQALERIRDAGILVPYFSETGEALSFPVLGRRRHHTRGKDIIPIPARDQAFENFLNARACDFFVQYVPRQTEFRTWIYRRRHLATYEKTFAHPERLTGTLGFSADNGFAFEFVREAPVDLIQIAAASVEALELDFGAVDILKGLDGRYYVLEVNTAPGVEGPRQGLVNLVSKIARWHELGFPGRRGT